MASIIGNLGPSVQSSQYLLNQGSSGTRLLALGGFTWTANPAASTHLSGTTNPLESYSAPSALAVPASGQDWGYNTNKYGYDTGGVTLVASPANGRTEVQPLNGPFSGVVTAANEAAFPPTGTTGVTYVALDTLKTYYWTGTDYALILQDFPISIHFKASSGGGTGTAHLKVEFMGRIMYESTGSSHDFALKLTPTESGLLLSNAGILKYRAYAMNNENSFNRIEVNITPVEGVIFTHIV